MTARELIERLSAIDPETTVLVGVEGGYDPADFALVRVVYRPQSHRWWDGALVADPAGELAVVLTPDG